jgi:hypothetical protein
MRMAKKSVIALGVIASVVMPTGSVLAQSAPADPPAGGTLEQRIDQRKAERNIQVDERDINRLKNRCIGAQGNLRELQQKAVPNLANRNKLYGRIDAKLWVVIGRLKLADRDTFELEKRRSALADKAAGFQVTTNNYLQTIDDAIVINCQADIIGFKALLDTVRIYHTQLRDQSADIRAFVVDQIKPIITDHANALKPKTATEEGN